MENVNNKEALTVFFDACRILEYFEKYVKPKKFKEIKARTVNKHLAFYHTLLSPFT